MCFFCYRHTKSVDTTIHLTQTRKTRNWMKIVGDTPKIVSANPARVHLIHHLSNSRSFQNTKHVIRFPPRASSFIRHKKKKKKRIPQFYSFTAWTLTEQQGIHKKKGRGKKEAGVKCMGSIFNQWSHRNKSSSLPSWQNKNQILTVTIK